MIFKEDQEAKLLNEYSFEIHENLMCALCAIDKFCRMAFDKHIVITDLLREKKPGRVSFHTLGQGGDIRTHFGYFTDRETQLIDTFLKTLNHSTSNRLQYSWHPEMKGTANEHLHVEWDTKIDGVMPE
jgi:hypothetical protein